MKKTCILILFMFGVLLNIYPQDKKNGKDTGLQKTADITDRAAGIHNASNIGLFFENRGKLYPRSLTQGPSGEYPINSGHNYIYRLNPMIAFPGNVIQGRFTTDEEWEAAVINQAHGIRKQDGPLKMQQENRFSNPIRIVIVFLMTALIQNRFWAFRSTKPVMLMD